MEIKNWFDLDGDNTLALDWPLTENSHVWEIGGFEGRWAQQIWDKFHCNITIFEPQMWAVAKMQKRFEGIEKINIRPYGLWIEDKFMPIGNFHTDGASIIKDDGREEKRMGEFRRVSSVYYGVEIDVCLMNIEGAEYELIPRIISTGMMKHFKNFWCQFHPTNANDTRHLDVFEQMKTTHDMLWNCYPTAVAWRKR
ncbi:MAG: hypothetical protein IPI97_14885 [Nitrosomonas sp.]|nr:hypothetical protein [Nitrosomonas sp.]